MFYLTPGVTSSDRLPIGAEFECIYPPEPTVGDGWVRIRFRVVVQSFHAVRNGEFVRDARGKLVNAEARGVRVLSKTAISEDEARVLWERVQEGESE